MAKGIKTGGRQAGTLNKATAALKELAQPYAPEALDTLRRIMQDSESDAARVSAAKEILDRAYGKPFQSILPEQNTVLKSYHTESDMALIERYYKKLTGQEGKREKN